MTNRPKRIGTTGETAVVRFLRANGFGNAERRALRGTEDAGDITGTPGLCWEIKAGQAAKDASENQVRAWLRDTDRELENAHADIGLLVMHRTGYGPSRCGSWWTVTRFRYLATSTRPDLTDDIPLWLTLAEAATWLRANGYGDPLD